MDLIENVHVKPSKLWLYIKRLFLILLILLIVCLGLYLRVQKKYSDKIVSVEDVPKENNTAIVFGAGLKAKGEPGQVLEDRILTAIDIYQAGRVDQLLMSGDNSQANHNEVQAMKNLAIEQGLSSEVILLDHAGISTYDSCLRAQTEFKLQKVVLVTQEYHLKRALYVCNELGLDAYGVVAGTDDYKGQLKFSLREIAASISDWFEVLIR